jgi:hypothetical protein
MPSDVDRERELRARALAVVSAEIMGLLMPLEDDEARKVSDDALRCRDLLLGRRKR